MESAIGEWERARVLQQGGGGPPVFRNPYPLRWTRPDAFRCWEREFRHLAFPSAPEGTDLEAFFLERHSQWAPLQDMPQEEFDALLAKLSSSTMA